MNSISLALLALVICFVADVNGEEKSKAKHPNHVYWLIESSVKDGELKNLKALNAEMVKATKANEPGTLSYDWSVSPDGKTCFFFERYADSEAVMIHTKTFGEKYAERLMTMIEIKSFQVFGKPNDDVKKGLSDFGAKFHQSIGGFAK